MHFLSLSLVMTSKMSGFRPFFGWTHFAGFNVLKPFHLPTYGRHGANSKLPTFKSLDTCWFVAGFMQVYVAFPVFPICINIVDVLIYYVFLECMLGIIFFSPLLHIMCVYLILSFHPMAHLKMIN